MSRLQEARLTVILVKLEFGHARVEFLGHVVGLGQVAPVSARIEAISKFPIPTNQRELMRFLGMAGYYRKFCYNFSTLAELLTNLLRKGTKYVWSADCLESFQKIKSILLSMPILIAPDFHKQFKLFVDVSDIGCGTVLVQKDSRGFDHPVCYYSQKFNGHQKITAQLKRKLWRCYFHFSTSMCTWVLLLSQLKFSRITTPWYLSIR